MTTTHYTSEHSSSTNSVIVEELPPIREADLALGSILVVRGTLTFTLIFTLTFTLTLIFNFTFNITFNFYITLIGYSSTFPHRHPNFQSFYWIQSKLIAREQ